LLLRKNILKRPDDSEWSFWNIINAERVELIDRLEELDELQDWKPERRLEKTRAADPSRFNIKHEKEHNLFPF
jgi:hypothetical protein